ncbi:hypothetical protein [Deinococcus sp.]|uniref:hypothetical protein n=1 Tax=Deinococcus sp. TaxID=47478 RepID=UPI00286DF43D|nr:hypothetical protein [Deinococcus sp.]
MNSAGDRPLTRGEETALLLACLCLTPLVAVIAYFWWRDSSPQRANSVVALARWFFTVILIVVAVGAALSFLAQLLRH